NGGEVIYSVSQNATFTKNLQKEKRSTTNSLIVGLSENLKEIELSLIFNSDNASFYTLKKAPMINAGSQSIMQEFAINMAYTGDYFRLTEKEGIFYDPNSLSDADLIVQYEDLKWELIDEQKKIGNYVCYKANSEMVIKNTQGNFHRKVVAWYCPDIPVDYGPSRFGGLPGLILEVDDGEMHYKAMNIQFRNKIKIPKARMQKITLVSEKEYQAILVEK